MTSRRGYQIIEIHIRPNISLSKGNQPIKFGRLIEYNKRNVALQYISIALNLVDNKNNLYNILGYLSRGIPNFDFLTVWQ